MFPTTRTPAPALATTPVTVTAGGVRPLPPPDSRTVGNRRSSYSVDRILTRALRDNLPVTLQRQPFQLDPAAAAAAPTLLELYGPRHDEPKVGLVSVTNETVNVRESNYHASIVTNFSAGTVVTGPDWVWDPAALAIDPFGNLRPIGDTQSLSNHLGGSVLAVRTDGTIVVCGQPTGHRQAGTTAPTGSGSFDLDDLSTGDGLLDLAARAIGRELSEEAGLDPRALTFHPLGGTRELTSAGKPDLFLLTVLPDGLPLGAGDRDGEREIVVGTSYGPAVAVALRVLARQPDTAGSLAAICHLAATELDRDRDLIRRLAPR